MCCEEGLLLGDLGVIQFCEPRETVLAEIRILVRLC